MNTTLIGIAGVHYVVSELSRRGLVALPTIRNAAAYDIVALNVEGTWHANIQVKTSSKRIQNFPMPPPEKVRAGPRDFYVLVRWLDASKKYEAFLLTGRDARQAVEESCKLQSSRVRKGTRKAIFPVVALGPGNSKNAQRWAQGWIKWRAPK